MRRAVWTTALLAAGLSLGAGEIAGGAPTSPAAPTAPTELARPPWPYLFPAAGYRMSIPGAYQKLGADESRRVTPRLAPLFAPGEDRTPRVPPMYFRRDPDTRAPLAEPPSFSVSFIEAPARFAEPDLPRCRETLHAHFERQEGRRPSFTAGLATVASRPALRVERELLEPGWAPRRQTIVLVPGAERTYELTFHFLTTQETQVKEELEAVLRGFEIVPDDPGSITLGNLPGAPPRRETGWSRVLCWTAGGFVAGLLLHTLIRKVLARKA